MVDLVLGHMGTGKTKKLIEQANEKVETAKGSLVFINKDDRLMYDLKHSIRVVSMEEFPGIENVDEYIGFIYGIISSDSDLEVIFIDSLLKHADIKFEDLPGFLERIIKISNEYDVNFSMSLSAEKEELEGVDFSRFNIVG